MIICYQLAEYHTVVVGLIDDVWRRVFGKKINGAKKGQREKKGGNRRRVILNRKGLLF